MQSFSCVTVQGSFKYFIYKLATYNCYEVSTNNRKLKRGLSQKMDLYFLLHKNLSLIVT